MKSITPEQHTGKAIDASSEKKFSSETEAKTFFREVKEKLQNVNHWHETAGKLSATFRLVDSAGQPVNRDPEKGDYFQIDIPGPGSKTGDGYDWAQVEAIEESESSTEDSFSIRVRPAENPNARGNDTAHFYSPESTSTFLISRKNNTVTAAVHDRNIKPNTDTDEPVDQVRDAVVGTAGLLGFSKIQWQKLTDGLIGD
jgi:hypothetical protein